MSSVGQVTVCIPAICVNCASAFDSMSQPKRPPMNNAELPG